MRNLALVALVLFGVGCSALAGNPCSPDNIDETLDPITAQAEEFDDAVQIAESSSRMTLAGPLADLQEIRRETRDVEVAECAQPALDALLAYMDAEIELLLAFATNDETDAEMVRRFDASIEARDAYLQEILVLTGVVTAEP